jgi:hypothetical protein
MPIAGVPRAVVSTSVNNTGDGHAEDHALLRSLCNFALDGKRHEIRQSVSNRLPANANPLGTEPGTPPVPEGGRLQTHPVRRLCGSK